MKRIWFGLIAIATIVTLPVALEAPANAHWQIPGMVLAQRQTRPDVKLLLRAEKQIISTESGQQRPTWQAIKDGTRVNPGDLMRYVLQGRNDGMAAARGLVLSQPIPPQMVYVLGSAQAPAGTKTTFSIDGGRTFVAKPMVKIKQANGEIIERPAPAEAYTHVRWGVGTDVQPKATIQTSYEARVR
jgi:uncharacterized repeat protein (TIGR01451 family)